MIVCRLRMLIAIICCITACWIVSQIYSYVHFDGGHIYTFNLMRDRSGILDIFKNNWKELVEGTDYSPEYMVQQRKPSSEYIDKLTIKVMREKNKLAGFIAYYRENQKKGMILLLGVGHAFRGKGYGKILMRHAIKDLLLKGVNYIGIWVLVDNIPAKKIYKDLGFVEKCIQENSLYLEYYN